jgi:hypothetical protein
MALLDSRAIGVKCPECGTWGAKKSLFKVKCVNPSCRKYDSEYASAYQLNRISGKPAAEVFPDLKGKASPGDYSLCIRYKNFRGDELIYSADPKSGYIKNEHLVIRVAPAAQHISFRLSAIQNRSDVESLLPKDPQPNPDERKILNHHLRRGTTSRLFKEVREKYPDYQP